MTTSKRYKQALLLTIPSISMLLIGNSVNAEVYKWRDSRGIVQYSDKPPIGGFTKTTKNEIVNALQKSDLCSAGPAVTTSKGTLTAALQNPLSSKDSLNFFTGTNTGAVNTTSANGTSLSNFVKAKTRAVSVVKVATPTPTPTPTPSAGANIIQVGLMPAVDISKNIVPVAGFAVPRVQATSTPYGSGAGEFRISCGVSHMSNDDPMVFPNQQGATHHHTFYGNTSINYKSDLNNLANVGNSTCTGGTLNRSGYWHPTIIDTATNKPVLLIGNALFYYKTGFGGVKPADIKPPPKGLRMLAGNPKATSASQASSTSYVCFVPSLGHSNGMPWQKAIPNCKAGEELMLVVQFPQCWDGKNLDSPNHQDHMAYPSNGCPASHPVPIPSVSLNMWYKVTANNQTSKWRLASDNYATTSPGGYSGHADWVNGWDAPTMAGIVSNCLNKSRDGHAHLLCDGRTLY
jgi:Domain of unknown function (DUF1996)/Domain of unknown function (DUF4124)